jgi:hypothetical protein
MQQRAPLTNLTQSGDNTQRRSGYQSGLSFNWSISPKDELTASVGFNHFGNHNNGFSNQDELKTTTAGAPIYDLLSNRTSDSRFHVNATDLSLAYKKQFKTEGQELEILYSTSYGKNTFSYFNEQDYLTGGYPTSGSRSNNPGNDRETNISIDYTQPFSKTFTLEAGAKAVIENLKNVVNTDTLTKRWQLYQQRRPELRLQLQAQSICGLPIGIYRIIQQLFGGQGRGERRVYQHHGRFPGRGDTGLQYRGTVINLIA